MGIVALLLTLTWGPLFAATFASLFATVDVAAQWPNRLVETCAYAMFPLVFLGGILDFSKIEAGRMDVESHPFDVRRCIESALTLVRARAFEKGIELVATIDEDVPVAVSGDVTRLRQVLLNLLANAIKLTDQGGVSLPVERGDGDELRFAVRDTGIGLSTAGMGRLFQRFGQAEAGTTREYGGTGLGLSISKRLAEPRGGSMTVASEGPGRGSTFRFTARAPAREASTTATLDPRMAERHPLRLLLAEDNVVNRKLALRILQQMEYRADLASNGIEAVEAVGLRPYDVVSMDVLMPAMDGLDATRAIVDRLAVDRRPRIVAMTANATQGDREQCIAAGMDDYLTKPIRVERLVDALMRTRPREDTSIA